MWMGRSVEGGRESSSINSHPYGSSSSGSNGYQHSQFRSYNGSNQDTNNADWKSRLVENGQWLGGKVLEYGVKLARRSSHNDIPDHRPVNDGRANWMADIRNGSYNYNASSQQSYNNHSSGYQNDFTYGRPSTYSDQVGSNQNSSSNYSSGHVYSNNNCRPKIDVTEAANRLAEHKTSRHKSEKKSKRKGDSGKKSRSKAHLAKSSRRRSPQVSSSESEEESETSSVYSESEEEVEPPKPAAKSSRRCARSDSSSKESSSESCEESSSEDDRAPDRMATKAKSRGTEKAVASGYKYSFDPSNIPRPPAPKKSQKTTKSNKSKEKSTRESQTKKKPKKKQEPAVVVDLLDVEFSPAPVANATSVVAPSSAPTPDVFDLAPIDQLAGLDFGACPPISSSIQPETKAAPVPSIQAPQRQCNEGSSEPKAGAGLTIPGSELFDLDSLVQVTKVPKSNKTLNELQQQGGVFPVPSKGYGVSM